MRTANPALHDGTFEKVPSMVGSSVMTLDGVTGKTFLLGALLVFTASITWTLHATNPEMTSLIAIVSAIAGFIVALITVFKQTWSPITAPIYAALEGLFLGSISAVYEGAYSGIVLQAIGLTIGTLLALLLAYRSRLIPVTDNLRLGIVAATGGIALIYLASIILSFFGISIPLIHESGPVGIGFSIVVVIIAALNLVLDFDFIEEGVKRQAPKYMEWYASFGLMVTLVWLYIEMLRLLSKLRSR